MKNDVAPESVEPNLHNKPDDIGTVAAKQKKPYEKPAFRHEKVFVTAALSCGKLSGTCMNSKVS
jgi:hypothetical protein